ncbi:MAG: 50S ribosomal protein L2 [Candidatus Yanofskybacteria bacterium CG10_big_fil_rev_8_21_14_0_10_46_23]|uniref:Large ribosomal subunit protein uL2 n=1 Tax=Candidatus Yanofskybacteria bacterium CG10_big_fil_rev_8_21_14_0_10_46_23 TaxID=1975098 RepID=A0A2H0R424_9BACT|nr:MAG: 50S ribosomal protein L2 [Candidatus Yanofskybacteria bacterium CG10_big_fil_rev_8_21_14_0_10_46_23]
MAKIYKPTTPGRRGMTGYDFSGLSKVAPLKSKTTGFKRDKGRNNQGRITVRHRGGGAKRLYREIDFKQEKMDIEATVFALEYDPNRTTRIARLHYKDGDKRYVLAPEGLKVGDVIKTASKRSPLKLGNRVKLKYIPQGTQVYNIEMTPGRGGQVVRSAGSFATVLARDGGYTQIQMPSSEVRQISSESFASIGRLSNSEHNKINLGKAGRSRHLGIRPTVRGSAMNPVDHKYGGGEGKSGRGTRRPKDIWGNITGGRKTRKKKNNSNKFIVRRRKK